MMLVRKVLSLKNKSKNRDLLNALPLSKCSIDIKITQIAMEVFLLVLCSLSFRFLTLHVGASP